MVNNANCACAERLATIVPNERCNAGQDDAAMAKTSKRRQRRTARGDRATAMKSHGVPVRHMVYLLQYEGLKLVVTLLASSLDLL
eukprot:CAMPEP_0203947152 /NCGR_PEP_ID=MMETSP0359-20131031/82199_1 /ASSEMBLY_ACC=CAM_ASM_000338 /TAXON_ID=268821 /ORGANISM="Scrippsiella Hangoei, Strain SHTV-5" /LENGTH=84 /DNA_ID=CAMNT_0050878529 /DNA_START=232 /DNA_END=484 /DNA_ORIENTATION=+